MFEYKYYGSEDFLVLAVSSPYLGHIGCVSTTRQSAAYLFEYRHHGSEDFLVLAVSSPYLSHIGCVSITRVQHNCLSTGIMAVRAPWSWL